MTTEHSHLDELVSLEVAAAADFEPVPKGEIKLPTNEQWAAMANPHLIALRFARLVCEQTKPGLAEVLEQDEIIDQLTPRIKAAVELFESFAELGKAAECRILCVKASKAEAVDKAGAS